LLPEGRCGTGCFIALLSHAHAAQSSPEDRYIATREAAIERLRPIFDAGNVDDAANKAEDAVRIDLQAQMTAILGERKYPGFGAAKLNLDTLYKGDQGYGMLDGLRFDAEVGKTGEKAGENGADGKYVEPRAHIIVTTPTIFTRWLHAHKDWWDKGLKNVPQQIGAALKNESFYTQAISTDAAVVNFNRLPIVKPAEAAFVHGFLAGRTQSDIPNAADEVFVSAVTGDRVYIAYGSIVPKGGDRGLHRDPDRLQQAGRGRGRRLPVQEDRQEGLRQARRPAPKRRGRLRPLLHAARAAATVICRSNQIRTGIVGCGHGQVVRRYAPSAFTQKLLDAALKRAFFRFALAQPFLDIGNRQS
jgi:hypothetical protein